VYEKKRKEDDEDRNLEKYMEDCQTEVSGLCWGRVGGLRCALCGGGAGLGVSFVTLVFVIFFGR
jgi:hypothetical protein